MTGKNIAVNCQKKLVEATYRYCMKAEGKGKTVLEHFDIDAVDVQESLAE